MKHYLIKALKTGLFSGNLSAKKLHEALNEQSANGWKFVRSIHETQRFFLIFSREAHFLIFERETGQPNTEATLLETIQAQLETDPTPHLLRQLLRSYGIEPEA